MKKISAIIVDDEIGALEAMESIVQSYPNQIDLVGKARNIANGIKLLRRVKPELVFLDVRIYDQKGFEILEQDFDFDFEVVFVTAYDEYALEAFKSHALSYLLKPVSFEAFEQVLHRATEIISAKRSSKQNVGAEHSDTKIQLPEGSSIEYIRAKDLIMVKAAGSYCDLHLQQSKSKTISKPLKFIENQVSNDQFIRVHRSYLINSSFIQSWSKTESGMVELVGGWNAPVSREGRKLLRAFFRQ